MKRSTSPVRKPNGVDKRPTSGKRSCWKKNESAKDLLNIMKCPKCGMQLEELAVGDVHVDKCPCCEGIWLDKGELDVVEREEAGSCKDW